MAVIEIAVTPILNNLVVGISETGEPGTYKYVLSE